MIGSVAFVIMSVHCLTFNYSCFAIILLQRNIYLFFWYSIFSLTQGRDWFDWSLVYQTRPNYWWECVANPANGNSLCLKVMLQSSLHLVFPCISSRWFYHQIEHIFFPLPRADKKKKNPCVNAWQTLCWKGLERHYEWTMVCVEFKSTLPGVALKKCPLGYTLEVASYLISKICYFKTIQIKYQMCPLLLILTASRGCDHIPNVTVTRSRPDARVERAAHILSVADHFYFI